MYAYQLKHTVNECLPMKFFAPSFIGAICGAGLFILAWHFLPAPETASMVVAKGNALKKDRAIKDEVNENRQLSFIDDNHAKNINDRIDAMEKLLIKEIDARKKLAERLNEVVTILSDLSNNNDASYTINELPYSSVLTTAEPSESITEALSRSGLDPDVNEQLRTFIGAHRMELVELRDKAAREDWIDSPAYLEMRDALADPDMEIREMFGDAVYERYLYAMGVPNRVMVRDVYPDTQAAGIDIQPGDIILRYDSEPIFKMGDLRQATVEGNKEETVEIEFLRNGQSMSVIVQRGPIGLNSEGIIHTPITGLNNR